MILVLAILAQVRVQEALELRDRFREVLAPGLGNRVTCANVYVFSQEMRELYLYDFPDEVFEACGNGIDTTDDDDDDLPR